MMRIVALALIAGLLPTAAAAQRPDVTIVFNVDQRAFVCWFEGTPTPIPPSTPPTPPSPPPITGCSFGNAYAFRDNVHFYRGQRVSIRLVGARIADSFAVDLKVDDLLTPGIPVFGADVALPALQPLDPASRLVLATGVVPVSGALDIVGTRLVPLIDKSEPTEYQKIIEAFISDANRAELAPLLGGSVTRVTNRLDALLATAGQLQQTASGIQADVASYLLSFSTLQKKYCNATAASSPT